MQTSAQLLEHRTQLYWNLSQVWNGRSAEEVPTGDAIEWCSAASFELRPELQLKSATKRLLGEIVSGGSIWMGESWENVVVHPAALQNIQK